MRKIVRKSSSCPKILRAGNLKIEKADLIKYYLLPDDKRKLSRPPINNEKIFNSEVRSALANVFSNRCAWCETYIKNELELNVEHFRPRSNADNVGKESISSVDHYGWFVYEWENLFLTCKQCNYSKRNLFPVESLRAKPLSTWAEANVFERALLLNPCKDDPLLHLYMNEDGTYNPLTEKGENTCAIFNLNREELVAQRYSDISQVIEMLESDISPLEFSNISESNKLMPGVIYNVFARFANNSLELPSSSKLDNFISDTLQKDRFPRFFIQTVRRRRWDSPLTRYPKVFFDSNVNQYMMKEEWHLAHRRLAKVSIQDFKGLENFSLDFDKKRQNDLSPCSMLLGENSTGKSSVLQAISLAMLGRSQRSNLKLNYSDYMIKDVGEWSNTNWNEAHVKIIFTDGSESHFTIDTDFNTHGQGIKDIVFLAYGARRNIAKPSTATVGLTQPSTKTLFNPDGSIPNPTAWLRECSTEKFAAVARAMKEILSLKQDDEIFRDDEGNVLVQAHKRLIPIDKMSDGYKTIFYIVLDIMRNMINRWDNLEYASGIVLIDEIETHLHPRWKMQVVGAFRRAMPNVQFIFTTHDPLCLRGMFDGEVHVLRRDSENRIVEETDLPNFQGLRTEQILTSDYFGLLSTNDPDLERKIEEYGSEKSNLNDNSPYIKLVEKELSQMTVLGKTLSQRIVHEALARYLEAAKNKKRNTENLKEDAINEIISVLKNKGIKND
jgi:uncharacterized protein (TIGR02646 family)